MYKFIKTGDDHDIEITVKDDDISWDLLAEFFYDFLVACTYLVTKEELGQSLIEDGDNDDN